MFDNKSKRSIQGVGIGLRTTHIQEILTTRPKLPWLEILTDNFLSYGGSNRAQLETVRQQYPLCFHGVGLSLGSTDSLNLIYLKELKNLIRDLEPIWISEHLCFSAWGNFHSHDLLPLPYTETSLNHICNRIDQAQEFLQQPLLIENITRYVNFKENALSEGEFLNAICQRTGCYLLLDINNAYLNQQNLGESCQQLLAEIPLQRVKEIHLAGFSQQDHFLVDTHSRPVAEEVWKLYQQVITLIPNTATLIEWDNDLPSLDVLLAEQIRATKIQRQVQSFSTLEKSQTLTARTENILNAC